MKVEIIKIKIFFHCFIKRNYNLSLNKTLNFGKYKVDFI